MNGFELTEQLQSHEQPNRHRQEADGVSEDALPLSGGGLELGEGLAEGCAVQDFLLFQGQRVPCTLFLLAESLNKYALLD